MSTDPVKTDPHSQESAEKVAGKQHSQPDTLTKVSLLLLLLLAALLLWPLVTGGPSANLYLVVFILLARLVVQVLRARQNEQLKRPVSWAFDLILIGLLFYTASNQ